MILPTNSTIGYIYRYRNIINNKSYIGQTWYPANRRTQHKYDIHKNRKRQLPRFYNAVKKYGWEAFEYSIIASPELIGTKQEQQDWLDWYEYCAIELYDSIKNGYNIKKGGSNGKHSQESKIKESNTKLKGKYRPTDEELIYKYEIDKKSTLEIAKIYNISKPTIIRRLNEANIILRSNSEAKLKGKSHPTQEELYNLYCNNMYSTHKISEILDLSQPLICRLLTKYNIEKRKSGRQSPILI